MRIDLLLDGPMDSQIELVRWLFRRARRASYLDAIKPPRIQRQQFPQYLRLLDARSDGASYGEIAKLLLPRRPSGAIERLKKQYKAAVRLRDGGYKDLLLWGRVSIRRELHGRNYVF